MNNSNSKISTGISENIKSCLHCGLTTTENICQRCHSKVEVRKKDSVTKTLALLFASIICFFPANLLPVMTTISIKGESTNTILSGVVVLWEDKMYFVAIIVFIASIITPIFKMCAIAYLCYSTKKSSKRNVYFCSKLYHFIEIIGRWSMIDVFVVGLLSALVQMGSFATIKPEPGIIAFAIVVVLTIFTTSSFDPRLIWDKYNKKQVNNGK